jgi:RNA polymerase sigma-32 factor
MPMTTATPPSGRAATARAQSAGAPESARDPKPESTRGARLTAEAERELALRYQGGEAEARGPLVAGCLDCVVNIALEYRRWGAPIEDLVQEGNIGLLKAVEHFDPSRGVRLATYARFWIRAEIREYVARQYRIVRLGASKGERRALRLYRKTREQRPEVLAAMSGVSTERATAMLPLLMAGEVSLSPQPDEDRQSLLERIGDGSESAEDALVVADERQHLKDVVERVVGELSEREQDIVRRRLLADDPMTLERLGAAWGVSKERVRQLEEAAKARMRVRLQRAV